MTGWLSSSHARLINSNYKDRPFILVIYLNPFKVLVKLTDDGQSPTQAGFSVTTISLKDRQRRKF